ncbi:MAG: HAMP domain-containing protein [Alphaproteobacteria bacterium]
MLRTVTFRLALVQIGLFAGFSLALLGFVYYATVVQTQSEADAVVDQEFSELANIYEKSGMNALNQEVFERAASAGPQLYVLADPRGDIVAGDFGAFPQLPASGSQRVPFEYKTLGADGKTEVNRARGRIGRIDGGPILMVARDMASSSVLVRRVTSAVNFGAGLGLILSLISGYFASRQAARRAEALSRTAKDVMRGDLTRRAPVVGANDEFDTLAQDLNAMLDRIERLMRSARTAGDAIAHDLRTPLTACARASKRRLNRHRTKRPIARRCAAHWRKPIPCSPPSPPCCALRACNRPPVGSSSASIFRPSRAIWWNSTSPSPKMAAFRFPVISMTVLSRRRSEPDDASAVQSYRKRDQIYARAGARATSAPSVATGLCFLLQIADRACRRKIANALSIGFVRLEAARSTPGAGLGLSLVAAVAEVHRAELKLEDGLGGSLRSRPARHADLAGARGERG